MAGAVVLVVPIRVWQRLAMPGFMVALALLVLVLIPGVGHEVNGAHRWIPLGPLNFQPSELMKVAVLLFAADYTVRKQEHMQNFARGFLPMACALAVVGMVLLLEPDLGAFMVIVAIRSEEHTSELQSLMRISYAVFCLKKKTSITTTIT